MADKNLTENDFKRYQEIVGRVIEDTKRRIKDLPKWEIIHKMDFQTWKDWQNGKTGIIDGKNVENN